MITSNNPYSTPCGFGWYNADNPKLTLSKKLAGLLENRPDTLTEILKQVHPEDTIAVLRSFVRLKQGLEEHFQPLRILTLKGKIRYLNVIWQKKPSETTNEWIAAVEDITDKKEFEELLDSATNLAKMGGWETDFGSNKSYWSPMTRKIHGVDDSYTPDLFRSLEFFKDDYRENIHNAIQKCILSGETFDIEAPIITAKGEEQWVRIIGKAEHDKGVCTRIYGSFQNVHHRKETELWLKSIADNLPGVLCQYILYPDGTDRLSYVSNGSTEIWGLSPEECMKDMSILWEQLKKAGDYERILQSVRESAKNLTQWNTKWKFITRHGKLRWHEGYGFPRKMADGSVIWDTMIMDITDKMELSELVDRTTRLARIGSWEMDFSNGNIDTMYWSPMTREIFEINQDLPASLQHGINYFTKISRKKIAKAIEKLIATGEPFDLEVQITTAQGNRCWTRCIRQSERVLNRCTKIFGSIQDIQHLKATELELRNILKERNTILESIGDGFFSVDKNWIITYWNQQAENILEKGRKSVIGKNLWEVYPEAQNTIFSESYQTAMKTRKIQNFDAYYAPLNIWLEVSAYPSRKGLSVYFKDISLRKQSEEVIRINHERFEKAAEATHDAIWDWDIVKETLYWGSGFQTLFGYAPEETPPNIEGWGKLVHPDDVIPVLQSLDAVIEDPGNNKWRSEYRYLKNDNSYAYVIDRGTVIRNTEGKALRMVGAITDITYRKEYEESLKELNQSLEKYAHELELSNAELEQFAFIASHDLQEPLRMITAFLSQLERKYAGQLDEKALQYIFYASDGAKRMKQIILDLLEFSRAGKYEQEKEPVNIGEIIDNFISLRRKVITEKSALIYYENLPDITGFKTPLTQIFHNLLDNALKYAKKEHSPVIRVFGEDHNNHWRFGVQDNGIGIEPEFFNKIFIIFQRLHNRDEYDGTGMGLAIVKKQVESMNGTIGVTSEKGIGSTFYFTLPK